MRKLAFPIHKKLTLKTETIRSLARQELEAAVGGALTDATCHDACAQTMFGCQSQIGCHPGTGTCPV
jgi:hypothetical protein